MNNDKYKRSLIAKYFWLSLSVFFIVFCSCPVKRYIKIQLYKQGAPIESTSSNGAFSKELKDCNLIDKHGVLQVVRLSEVSRPKPLRPIVEKTPLQLFFPISLTEDLLHFFKKNNRSFCYHSTPHHIPGVMPLYLRCSRLQV